ncbi:MAG: family 78 glycoside hydrolase catalytic domain [Kiritimatiellales bacterium]|nr:family 78 glycoside hydrolase catalytic domain [Kiritimatiellales bacterium]MCF7863231.1 family 78 glycoside hydrolase catalytic domain [Kiritimatiellales bacterium]
MKKAKWIWCAGQDVHGYNQAALFKKEFKAGVVKSAMLRITADSHYRVSLNGKWINDGPGKAYPEHWMFDVYDIKPWLKKGLNRIEITARYYGIGTFHQIPQQAGLLAEIELDGRIIGTDASWQAARLDALRKWSPKVSVQMEPAESVDARLTGRLDWQPALELFAANKGTWKDLSPRRSAPLTKKRCRPIALHGAVKVKRARQRVCVPVTQIAQPGLIEANHYTSRPVILASVLTLRKEQSCDFSSRDWKVSVDGAPVAGKTTLAAGRHTALFFCASFYGHNKELPFPFINLPGGHWGAWKVFVKEEFLFCDNDRIWLWFKHPKAEQVKQNWLAAIEKLSNVWKTPGYNVPALGRQVDLPNEQLFMEDYTADFAAREPVGSASRLFDGKIVKPSRGCDIELCYDFGEQRCGYLDFSVKAPAGTVVDLHMVEHITPEGVVQHTAEFNRNGMRYITKTGSNRYTSLKRRSGRFLFVTFRNMTTPVELLKLEMIESTAAVKPVERFRCSDGNLNRIWDACERTLKMGMEDVFTDCSLYEQTLWIGDARNEALYAFQIYGNYSVSARSLEIGAQSLERFPIVGCQVPSSWDCLLPAWSFLWGMHAWEHYFHSGDKRFLKKLWPAMMQNMKGAFGFIDERGLFSGELWNLLEWAPMDQEHPTVLHNSLLLVGALRAAEHGAETLGDEAALRWLQTRRRKLIRAINAWWDGSKKSYPDAVLEDGTPSSKTCQHNSGLAVLCGVIEPEHLADAKCNLLDPPEGMTRINSPFAAQFHFEALEMLDEPEAIMDSIRKNYVPMLEAGATTVWETFPGSTCSPPGFPTRSHCHGWSCGPLQFFNRIVLGIRQTVPGGKAFEISPWIRGLQHASGAMATPNGTVHVDWKIRGKILAVCVTAPIGSKIYFKKNDTHEGLEVIMERR